MPDTTQNDLQSQWGKNFRKALIIALAAVLLMALTFISVRIERLTAPKSQDIFTLEDIPLTRRPPEEPPPRDRIITIIPSDEDTVPLDRTIDTTDLRPDRPLPPLPGIVSLLSTSFFLKNLRKS